MIHNELLTPTSEGDITSHSSAGKESALISCVEIVIKINRGKYLNCMNNYI